MSRLLTKYMWMLLFVVAVAACKKEADEPVTPSLETDKTELTFDQEGFPKATITITTNQEKWEYTVSDAWILTERNGNELMVRGEDYTGFDTRSGKIFITAGTLKKEISVSQSGAEPILEVDPTALDAPEGGGTYTVKVNTNAVEWTPATDADWCTLEKATTGDAFTVTVAKNKVPEERTATINITTNKEGLNAAITLKQAAYTPKDLLPNLEFGSIKLDGLEAFEKERGNKYKSGPSGLDYYNHTFTSSKEAYSQIVYKIAVEKADYEPSGICYGADMIFKDEASVTEELLTQITNQLKAEGFVEKAKDNKNRPTKYYHPERKIRAYFDYYFSKYGASTAGIYFRKEFVPASVPSFETLVWPYDKTKFGVDKKEEVRAYETEKGSTEKAYSSFVEYTTKGDDLHKTRIYTFNRDNQTLENVRADFHKEHFAKIGEVSPIGELYLSAEFIQFMAKEGYDYYDVSYPISSHMFASSDLKQTIYAKGSISIPMSKYAFVTISLTFYSR